MNGGIPIRSSTWFRNSPEYNSSKKIFLRSRLKSGFFRLSARRFITFPVGKPLIEAAWRYVIKGIGMRNFYEVLGISRTAQPAEIKAAFKRLAKVYHPDRNPGNKEAEEAFKTINEAYHTLIHPTKKSQYDFRLYRLTMTYQEEPNWEEIKKRRYYQWQKAQSTRYRFDKNYFKIQGLAFRSPSFTLLTTTFTSSTWKGSGKTARCLPR